MNKLTKAIATILFIFILIGIDVIVHEIYVYYKLEDKSSYDSYVQNRLKYEIFSRDMDDRVLGYMSGDWRSSNGSHIYFNLLSDPKELTIDNEKYNTIVIDKIDSVFGIVQLTAKDGKLVNQKFQINKIFDTTGLIVMIFDHGTTTCKEIRKLDTLAPICAKALYWRDETDETK